MKISDADIPEDTRSILEILEIAVAKWEGLTGLSKDATRYRMGDLDIVRMNRMIDEGLKLDPEGITSYLMLEVFLRYYLEDKTFTAAQIMKDYDATTRFLRDAEELFSVVQSDRALEIASEFRGRIRKGLARYGADRPEVLELLDDPDALPFLRRDALRSLEKLQPYQFLSGEADASHPQAIQHVHMAWSINDLLAATRDMRMSGIGLVLMRDAGHPNRSYFSFVMRNGGNVILLTDRTKPVYPGQEDRLGARGGRGLARDYASRTNSNHFPYQIIPTSVDDRGDVVFEKETAPIMAGLKLAPLMTIGDLPPSQAIWVTMMLSLISDRFWKEAWRAPQLSYTGAMIQKRDLLVSDASGAQLPAARDYRPIGLDAVRIEELTSEAMAAKCEIAPQGVNAWLEARYRDRVPEEILNLWHRNHDETLMLPRRTDPSDHYARYQKLALETATPVGEHALAFPKNDRLASWETPKGYELATFSATDFGTEAELQKDRLFIARKNMAAYVQKCADEEFAERKTEILSWYLTAVQKNARNLLALVALGEDEPVKTVEGYRKSLLVFGDIKDKKKFDLLQTWAWTGENRLGEPKTYGGKEPCYLTEAQATFRACFVPRDLGDIATLTGRPVQDIPDVLHHWGGKKDPDGNHLLNRMDPMETDVEDPWNRDNLKLGVNLYLSKRGYAQVLAGKF